MRRFGTVHSVVLTSFFSHSPVGPVKKIVLETGLRMAIKLQLRTLRRNVWCADIEGHGGRLTFSYKRYHQALHAHFGHWLSRWIADLVKDRSFESSNKTKRPKAMSVLGKNASGGWFVSGYVRLLQSQYESKSARTVLKILSQNLADYF